jgi:hypothetical protein
MTQFDRTTPNPNTHGGTFLASELNDWAAAVESMHHGASRPAYAANGMIWCKTVNLTIVELYHFRRHHRHLSDERHQRIHPRRADRAAQAGRRSPWHHRAGGRQRRGCRCGEGVAQQR